MARKRDDEGMRRRLVEAALAVFSRQSHLEASITEVAEEAGLAKGTVYLYFKSKDELVIEMFRHCMEHFRVEIRAKLDADKSSSAVELLRRTACLLLECANESRELWGLWYHFLALGASRQFREPILQICQEDFENCTGIFSEILQRGIDDGEFRQDIDLPAVSRTCFGVINGFFHLAFIERVFDIQEDCLSAMEPIFASIGRSSSPRISSGK